MRKCGTIIQIRIKEIDIKNKHYIENDIVHMEVSHNKEGVTLETIFDASEFDRVDSANLSWHLEWKQAYKKYYVKATKYLGMVNGKAKYKTTRLHTFLTQEDSTVYHINGDTMDNRLSNLQIAQLPTRESTQLEQLTYLQSLSLEDKIDVTCERIEQWYKHWDGKICVAFSGGKDSTVLLDIVRNKAFIPDGKSVRGVFYDTGLEFPEIRDFVKTKENIDWEKPSLTFREVIERFGYPVVSKEQSGLLSTYKSPTYKKQKTLLSEGYKSDKRGISKKWMFLTESPFKISNKCCTRLKKMPSDKYERRTGFRPMIATTVDESFLRKKTYLKHGCNAYDAKRPVSTPMAFWSEEDVWGYIKKYNIPYSKIYDMGYKRTGCMFCMYGIQHDTKPNRFQTMKKTHPQIYKYCIEKLGIGNVLDFMNIDYE